MSARRTLMSLLALVAVSALLLSYLVFKVLQINPLANTISVSLDMPQSGGLQQGSRVLYNGVEVGKVSSVAVHAGRVQGSLQIDDRFQVPARSAVSVENLSLVGEQYVNFASTTGAAPYLRDGDQLSDVNTGVSVAKMLAAVKEFSGQIDSGTLTDIADTITRGWVGRDGDLATLAQTSRLFAQTVTNKRSEFSGLFDNAQALLLRMGRANTGSVMRTAAPQLAAMNIPFATLWSLFPGLAQATQGAYGWYDVIIPFTAKIGEYMSKIVPRVEPVVAVLSPYLTALSPALRMDLAALVQRGLDVVDKDGVVRIVVKGAP